MNPVIIIPAYNPPSTFNDLVLNIINKYNYDIIIINDGSDDTIKFNISCITVYENLENKGKGYSLLKGFKIAYSRGFTHAITLDADSQHDPEYINSFTSVDSSIILVLGKRSFDLSMPIHRRASNIITSFIISQLCKIKIYDSQCGYRRYKLDEFIKINFNEFGFQFETEVFFKLNSILNNSLEHVDISTLYNDNGSSISNFKDTLKFINLILKQFLNKRL